MYFFKSSGNILYTCSNIKICKSIRSKQTVKNLYTFTNAKTCMDGNFWVKKKTCLGKRRCMGILYHHHHHHHQCCSCSNTTTVAAQVDPVNCLITIQHEGKVFCDTMMCYRAKVCDTSRDCTAFICMGPQSCSKS